MTLHEEGKTVLSAAGVPNPARDAERLLAHALGVERARLHLDPRREAPPAAAALYRALLARRARREPVQYLVGEQEFWSLALRVTPAVLIPRPETELVVAACIRRNTVPNPVILDLGTGSGCIAIAVAREIPGARVLASDVSREALDVARDNARRLGVEGRVEFRQGDLFAALSDAVPEGGADFILANPPYVSDGEFPGLPPEVRDHEPRAALVAGPDGLEVHRRIAVGAARMLRPGGLVIVEFGAGQADGIGRIYGPACGLEPIAIEPDLAGLPRVGIARAGGRR
ncbi:MAG: peptide chain release factor N(5)-glutamine methyltransferase [Candidatus Polarisedimenticolia bacterium]